MTDTSPVPVAVACQCPGAPHDGDTVYLRPTLDLRGGMIAQRKVIDLATDRGENTDTDLILATLAETYCLNGVVDWTLTNGDGHKLEVNEQTIRDRILSDFSFGIVVADAASDLYTAAVLDPLLAQVSKSSRPTSTASSTSARTGSSAKRRKRSKPSLTASTPTGDTEPTSV